MTPLRSDAFPARFAHPRGESASSRFGAARAEAAPTGLDRREESRAVRSGAPRWFRDSIESLLAQAVSASGAREASLYEPGLGEIQVSAQTSVVAMRPKSSASAHTDVGPIALRGGGSADTRLPDRVEALGRQADAILDRFRLWQRASRLTGADLAGILVGGSAAVADLGRAIRKVARADVPVAIEAAFGCDEGAAAAAIHCESSRSEEPFVPLHCASLRHETFRRELSASLDRAGTGTLYLGQIDALDSTLQKDLLAELTGRPEAVEGGARLVASSLGSLNALVRDGRFCRHVQARLDCLRVSIPALSDRRSDLRALIEYEIAGRLLSAKRVSDDLMDVFERYEWPENLTELRRTLARLVVLSDGDCIGLGDLDAHAPFARGANPSAVVLQSAPEPVPPIAEPANRAARDTAGSSRQVESVVREGEFDEETSPALVQLARDLLAARYEELDRYGTGLKRALVYIGRNYQSDFSLGELAQNAFLSPSHLSFLIKKGLGVPFKAVLSMVRIERAKDLFAERPGRSVTEISLDVGFGDLSNFEKTFKRIVGANPREYRRRLAATGGKIAAVVCAAKS